MPKFSVDVKAFMSVTVEASSKREARQVADAFVENLAPADGYIGGYNKGLADTQVSYRVTDAGGFDIDGSSEVEQLCEDCGEELWDYEGPLCSSCEPEPVEPPEDTPSLDDSFHRHEMDV